MTTFLVNHLWQSTIFVGLAALVAAALKRNGAHVRHAVWVVASLKFVLPFAWLMDAGGLFPAVTPVGAVIMPAATTASGVSAAVGSVTAPFTPDVFAVTPPATAGAAELAWTGGALVALWAIGAVAVLVMRLRGWGRIKAALRGSVPWAIGGPVPVRAAPGLLEPGVVGVWRPVLLLPADLQTALTEPQLRAVLEHEFAHVRRRDNLTAGIHMVVEGVCWFHPLVWWVGARMVEERERACDEAVLRVCGEPQTYAESILTVCKRYVESPVACVSGVTGADLKKRVAAIMRNHVGLRLDGWRRAAVTAVGLLAFTLPLLAGAFEQATSTSFSAVTIKPCAERSESAGPQAVGGGPGGPLALRRSTAQVSPGYVYWECVALAELVSQAYTDSDHPLLNAQARSGLQAFDPRRVRGGPGWVQEDKFTIEATLPSLVTGPALDGQARRPFTTLPPPIADALRAVLEERFQVKVRREREQKDMYALRIGRSGLDATRIKPTGPGECLSREEWEATDRASRHGALQCAQFYPGRKGAEADFSYWTTAGQTTAGLTSFLSSQLGQPVLDETGLTDAFSFRLSLRTVFGPQPAGSEVEPRDVEVARALAELRFTLDRTKGPVEYLVIDRAEKLRPAE
jgi:bla regulator protein BlaR1